MKESRVVRKWNVYGDVFSVRCCRIEGRRLIRICTRLDNSSSGPDVRRGTGSSTSAPALPLSEGGRDENQQHPRRCGGSSYRCPVQRRRGAGQGNRPGSRREDKGSSPHTVEDARLGPV